jgi:class 3 adenylate cyclase
MDEIHQNAGTINQFTGDGVMALFGAPLAVEDHAQQACRAAISIQLAMAFYGIRIEREGTFELKMRIGLNSGPVIVGSIGDDLRMDYTAVGDTTNLASRLESMAEPGKILKLDEGLHPILPAFHELLSLESKRRRLSKA